MVLIQNSILTAGTQNTQLIMQIYVGEALARKIAKPEIKTVTRIVAVSQTKLVKQESQQQTIRTDAEPIDLAPICPQPPLSNQQDNRENVNNRVESLRLLAV